VLLIYNCSGRKLLSETFTPSFTLPVSELEPTFEVLQAAAACLSAERAAFGVYMSLPSLLVNYYIVSNGFKAGISKGMKTYDG